MPCGSLELSPPTRVVKVGEIITLTLTADSSTSSVDSVDVYFDFDPTYLEIVDTAGVEAMSLTFVRSESG